MNSIRSESFSINSIPDFRFLLPINGRNARYFRISHGDRNRHCRHYNARDQILCQIILFIIISFAQSLYPLNLFSDSHLLFVFKPFNIFKNSFCFSFTRPTYEAKADAKINTFTYSLQIFPHFFFKLFFRNRRRRKLLQASSAKDEKHISQNVSEPPLRFRKRLQR